jgi:hypothetical protein
MPSYVPKIHPVTRAVEPDDPMFLQATLVEGDPEVMLRCLVQEYAWMGWGTQQILGLFRDPNYPVLNSLLAFYGAAAIQERVMTVLGKTGVFCCDATVREEPEPAEDEPELIQLGIRIQPPTPLKGDGHAEGL